MLPSGTIGGPVILGTVRGSGIIGANNVGIWAMDSGNKLRQVLRKGDLIGGRKVTAIHALVGVPGSLGASRGFNERGAIVARVQFPKNERAIIRIDIPDHAP